MFVDEAFIYEAGGIIMKERPGVVPARGGGNGICVDEVVEGVVGVDDGELGL